MDNLLKLVYELGKNIGNPITIRVLSVYAKVPYTTANRLIKQNKELFIAEKKGNSILCSINTDDPITKNYLVLAERKKANSFCKKNKKISVIRTELPKEDYAAILFGSRAEEKQRKKSDIDLLILNKNGKKNISFSKHEMLFNVEINPLFMSKKEFKHMLAGKKHNLADEVIKNHIILHGEEYFWNIILKNGI